MSDNEEGHHDIHASDNAETLAWDEEYLEKVKGVEPGTKYGAVSESIRHSISEKQACTIGCKGKDCKYCNPTGPKAPWKPEDMEIKGLFSNWVTDNILAISRPTTKAIEEFDIIGQFKSAGVRSIINLQQPGEHVSCGFGNEPEGFSYKSKDFMDNNIFFYNFGWRDYGVGSLENILDMVKVMQFAISEGKVAVHCHAGLGRTGVLIAAYLLYANRASPNDVIHYIRSKRSSAEDSEDDQSKRNPNYADFTLRQFMVRQQSYLHGQEGKRLKNIPKIVYCCCQRLLELAKRGHRHEFHDQYLDVRSTAPKAFMNSNNRATQNGETVSSQHGSESNLRLPLHAPRQKLRESFTAIGSVTRRSFQKLNMAGHMSNSSSASSLTTNGGESDLARGLMQRSGSDMSESDDAAQEVVRCMAEYDYSKEKREEIAKYKEILNTATDNYEQLYKIEDAWLVAALMYEWLDALREPALHPQDMPAMLMHDNAAKGLSATDKTTKGVIEVIFMTVARLLPIHGAVHDDLYCRILSTLTHQNMLLDMDYLHASSGRRASASFSRTSSSSGLMRSNVADKLMHYFVALTSHFRERLDDGYEKRKQKRMNQKATDRQINGNSDDFPLVSRKSSDRSLGKTSSNHSIGVNNRNHAPINEETGEEISLDNDQSRVNNRPMFSIAGESDTDGSY